MPPDIWTQEQHFLQGLPVPAVCVYTNQANSGSKAEADPDSGQEKIQKKQRKEKHKPKESRAEVKCSVRARLYL